MLKFHVHVSGIQHASYSLHKLLIMAVVLVFAACGNNEVPEELKTESMVSLAGGTFRMGSNDGDSDEKPVHSVTLSPFFIDKHEVTVAEYKKCVQAGQCSKPLTSSSSYNYDRSGRDDHPVNGVGWNDANTYCAYAGKRLPTEAEWEFAATWKSGTKYKYSSGKNSISCQDAVMDDVDGGGDGCGRYSTWPVGSKPQEINGTHDMAGNVWEWVSDWYGSYSSGSQTDPSGPQSGAYRISRGGSLVQLQPPWDGSIRRFAVVSEQPHWFSMRFLIPPIEEHITTYS